MIEVTNELLTKVKQLYPQESIGHTLAIEIELLDRIVQALVEGSNSFSKDPILEWAFTRSVKRSVNREMLD